MPTPQSIWSTDVKNVLDQGNTPGTRQVQVDGQSITIPTPFPSPEDWRDTIIYFLLVDRFNNPVAPPKHAPWNREYSDFQGGTLDGVRQQLDYLKTLGAGAVWISPVLKNCQYSASYHGYGIQDFLAIEPRFASEIAQAQTNPQLVEEQLRQLVDEAHARGIYVIFDIVLHHTGDVFAYQNNGSMAPWNSQIYPIQWRDEHGNPRTDWAEPPANPAPDAVVWPRELQQNRYFRRQGNAFGAGGQTIDPGGDFYSLKGLVTDYQDTTGDPLHTILIRAYQYIIAKFDVDAFRIDTLKYISPAFARTFANSIREFALSIGKKNFFLFGEVYDSEEEIAQFIGRNTQTSEAGDIIGVDAALDFPLFYGLPGVCKGELPPSNIVAMYERREVVERDVLSTHGDATGFFVTFLDNHDQTARYYYCNPAQPDALADQLSLGVACLYALPGIPCLYYGTEQGLCGSGDAPEAVREALWGKPDAFNRQNRFYTAVAQLAALRNSQPALRYGRHYFRPLSGDGTQFGISTTAPGVLAFSRILNDREIVIVANTSTQESWSGEVIVDISLNAAGQSYTVLFSNKAQPSAPGTVAAKAAGSVAITNSDGSVTNGPLLVVPVNLQPMEVQILAN